VRQGGAIDQAMAAVGYNRINKYVAEIASVHRPSIYKASWSSKEVEHLVYLGSDVARHQYFVGQFGIRASAVEKFAIESVIKYGHSNYRVLLEQYEPEVSCMMIFGFSRFDLAEAKIPQRVLFSSIATAEFAETMSFFMNQRLLPVIRQVTTFENLLRFLTVDAEPCPWFAVNRAIRAAQVVAIGNQLGFTRGEIRKFLAPHDRLIALDLSETIPDPRSSVDRFVDCLVLDWGEKSAARDAGAG
jgi:hypothetical protein